MALPSLPFKTRFTSSRQLIPGSIINALMDLLTSFQGTITAAVTAGALTSATPVMNATFNEVTTSTGTNTDTVALPSAQVGLAITIINSTANTVVVLPQATDNISGAGVGASVTLATGATTDYVCTKPGIWRRYTST